MARKNLSDNSPQDPGGAGASSSVDELLAAALDRGDESLETGRYLVTFKEGAGEEGMRALQEQGLRTASSADFEGQALAFDELGDADVVELREIGVALLGGNAAQARTSYLQSEFDAESPIESIDPEYFMFSVAELTEYIRSASPPAQVDAAEYLRGFARAAAAIADDLREAPVEEDESEDEALVLGATWGLVACRVPQSSRSGAGIRTAVIDTGFDLGHPDFAGRPIVHKSFVGQPVQDLNGHGTHVSGTASGPKAPAGTTPRYGIGFRTPMYVGKVLTNSGNGTQISVLAGMNWAIANRCPVINASLGAPIGVQPAYTRAGAEALAKGCLIIAAAGNSNGGPTGAPANSPTIMSVASLDRNLTPSSFSSRGKVEIAGPGRDVFSSWPRPRRYHTISGTSMAAPHVSGCASLWAETSASLRGLALWRKLQATARRLPFPATRVGAGLVQAPK